ncbi:MAG: hypothetical protein IPI46_08915 [Bacteroidetes bacterium]|nr:hypothetical protein [Bacteroidota bacterium]
MKASKFLDTDLRDKMNSIKLLQQYQGLAKNLFFYPPLNWNNSFKDENLYLTQLNIVLY